MKQENLSLISQKHLGQETKWFKAAARQADFEILPVYGILIAYKSGVEARYAERRHVDINRHMESCSRPANIFG